MKKLFMTIIVVALLAFPLSATALAQGSAPVGGCPDDFHKHQIMDHDEHNGQIHQHVGTSADQNGDGYLCVKHVSINENIHLHIDNTVPLN